VEEKTIRSMRTAGVKCFKCREKGHKCRECLLWIKRKNGEKRPARPVKGKAQEGERRLRRVEGSEAMRPTEGNAQQEEWERSSWKMLRKRTEWYCGPTVL